MRRSLLVLLWLFVLPSPAALAAPAAPCPVVPLIGVPEVSVTITAKQNPTPTSGYQVNLKWNQGVVPTSTPAPTCPLGSSSSSTAVTGNGVYRAATSGAEAAPALATLTTPSVTYSDTTVANGLTYFYEVTAINCAGESGKSLEVTVSIPNPVVPGAPTGLSVTSEVANNTVTPALHTRTFAWNVVPPPAAGHAIYYNIEREVTGTNVWAQLNSSPLIDPHYFDAQETKGALYGLRVCAWDFQDGKCGAWSATLFTGATQ